MRILFLNEKRGYFGGVEQNIADSVAGLRARGHRCFLAYAEDTARDAPGYGELFDETHRCVEAGAAEDAMTLAAIAEKTTPDVLYFHKIPALPERSALPAIRCVRYVHDHDLCCPRHHKYFVHNTRICRHPAGWRCWLDLAFVARDRSSPLGLRFQTLGPLMAELGRHRELDGLLTGSRFMRDELVMNGIAAERIHLLPPVVRMEEAAAVPLPEEPRILFVGQLIRGKGVDLLLRALALLDVPFTATIVGDGNARAGLEALAGKLGLDGRVTFAGWVDNRAIGAHYAAARVLAVPARWPEPFGMIGLEAMRHGRPVVAFRAGGIEDWLADGETGVLVGEQDVPAYARALALLLGDHALAVRMGEAARERVRSLYNFDDYLKRLEGLLAGESST
ncbi:MAG: hypothetical protein PWP23_2678 [Candidatus Sumerlaeota bacterium]|nr:hypothetical protein [Candidatus Sumerlaeota bacterium]